MLHEVDELLDLYGVVGSGASSKQIIQAPRNSSIFCGWCNTGASLKCLDCNEFMCSDCLKNHRSSPFSTNHSVIAAREPSTTPSLTEVAFSISTSVRKKCDVHDKVLQFVCEFCKKLICQCCTLNEHENHNIIQIRSFAEKSHEKINDALESISIGNKCIRRSIDKTLAFIRLLDRNSSDVSDNVRKTFRQLTLALEDREKLLLDMVEKLKIRRLNILNDQMAGLKSALSGLAETADTLQRLMHEVSYMDSIDIVLKIINGERQLEQFASIYKDLQPKQETIVFNPPDFNLLTSMKMCGRVVLAGENASSINPYESPTPGNLDVLIKRHTLQDSIAAAPNLAGASANFDTTSDWYLHTSKLSQYGFTLSSTRITQCIPGALAPVHVKVFGENDLPSLSFGLEGHEDGQVSRPWGLCIDKYGNIYISDRRNNRVQVFRSDGTLMFKFGRKGVGNGEFDLPAGICVDVDNRIIVVDKDNHRVQIFSSTGMFLLKFGSCGKEYGQFQYPWDVAVNSRRQIVVTDSRNHKIQQFDSEGRFIRQIVFENFKQNRGIVSPRGVCYTPQGNIIVSDFDNHCLYLIDPDINEILAVKGQEGSGHQEFNRPSGLCCDDTGNIIVADSKNQRIIVFNQNLEFQWDVEVRPSQNPRMPSTLDEKDRTCNVALMPDGRITFLIELSPDAKEGSNPQKRFVHVL
ncbi:protein wech [Condylostylus longicornis]|uniref:protein wech n=1 Tax=Condylostylus longicornis TaxID=2530218 RepID=UPI00244DDBC8|nr:protein wech [Condylostylus longicornis]